MLFLHGFRHWTKKQTITVVRAMKVPEQVGKLVRPERFELPTYCSGGNRSIQLSYGRNRLS
jgi:hypothetical protein